MLNLLKIRPFCHGLQCVLFASVLCFVSVNLYASCGGNQMHYADRTRTISLDGNGATSQGTTAIYGGYSIYLNYCGQTPYVIGYGMKKYTDVMGTNTNRITVPIRSGYKFTGYYSAISGGDLYIDASGFITDAGIAAGNSYNNGLSNTTWYAQWVPENATNNVTVHYNCGSLVNDYDNTTYNGQYRNGYNSNTTSTFTYGNSYNLLSGSAVCQMTNFIFDEWNCANGPSVSSGTWIYATDVTCTAKWRPSNGVVINLSTNDYLLSNNGTKEVYTKLSNGVGVYRSLSYASNTLMTPVTGVIGAGGANPVIIPDDYSWWGDSFMGYYDDNDNMCINSYGELTQTGQSVALSYTQNTTWHSEHLNPKNSIRLDSTGAAPSGHGTEFLAVINTNQQNQCPSTDGGCMDVANNNSCNSGIMIPLRTNGDTFGGYFSQPTGGVKYIDEYGCVTQAGLQHVMDHVYGSPSDSSTNPAIPGLERWYVHWVPKGTEIECGDGYSSGNLFDNLFPHVTTQSYIGYELSSGYFESNDMSKDDPILNFQKSINVGDFAVSYGQKPVQFSFGTSGCFGNQGNSHDNYWPEGKETDWLLDDAEIKPDGEYCWCKTIGYSVDGRDMTPVNSSQWIYASVFSDQQECESNCAQYCAQLESENSDFLNRILSNTEACVPDEHSVYYYCDEDAFHDHINSPLGTDTVYYSQVDYTVGTNFDLCDRNGYSTTGLTCLTSNYTAVNVVDTNPWTIDDDIYCFPTWAPNNYIITLNKQSGTGGSNAVYTTYQTDVYNDSAHQHAMTSGANGTNPITIPTRTDYIFKGYYPSTQCGGTQYISSLGYITENGLTAGIAVNSNNVRWYACWAPKVIFDCGTEGGEIETLTDYHPVGSAVSTPNAATAQTLCNTPSSSVLQDWNCADSGNWSASVSGGSSFTMPNTVVTCTADWGQSYSVTYNCGNNGTGTPPSDPNGPYMPGATVNLLANATGCTAPQGYSNFDKWNCTLYGGGDISGYTVGNTSLTMPAANLVCSADWASNSINLSWYQDDGTTTVSGGAQSCTYGDNISPIPTAPQKPGYHFLRWNVMQ